MKARVLIIAALLMTGSKYSMAQLNTFQSIYFQNQYLANPALAGMEKELNINLGYQKQWSEIPGSPKLQNLTADFGLGDKVGLGVTINNDQSGLISKTRVLGTFAYHIPFSDDEKLNFGVSFGVADSHLDYSKIVGDQSDISALDYNQRSVRADGDLGLAYTSKSFNVQAALPNLKSVFFKNDDESIDVDRTTFYTAASYKIDFTNAYSSVFLEPKIAFRGVKGFDNIFDAGANLTLHDYGLNVLGMYHTNKSTTLGAGLDLKDLGFLFSYTVNTGQYRTIGTNTFELGVRLKLFNK